MYLFMCKFYLVIGKQVKIIITIITYTYYKLINRNLFLLITM